MPLDPSIFSLAIKRNARGADLEEVRPGGTGEKAYTIEWGKDGVLRVLDGLTSVRRAHLEAPLTSQVDLAVVKPPIGSSKFRSVELLNPTVEGASAHRSRLLIDQSPSSRSASQSGSMFVQCLTTLLTRPGVRLRDDQVLLEARHRPRRRQRARLQALDRQAT